MSEDHGSEIRRSLSPLIGLTSYGVDDRGRVNLPQEYVSAVVRAGGMPVLIPPGQPDLDALLERIDGFLLAGGGDLHPRWYGGREHLALYGLNEERDRTELDLARRVLEERRPTFAICRGLQVVNVALGGSLHVHLPDVFGESVLHRAPPREPIPHSVRVDPESRLFGHMRSAQIEPMSWHHQALDELAPGLRPVAWAADEVVEAVEREGHESFLGVQWHPELTASEDPTQHRLFEEFLRQVRRSMIGRTGIRS